MEGIVLVVFACVVAAFVAAGIAQSLLVAELRNVYPQYYRRVGSPSLAGVWLSGEFNGPWTACLLRRRYAGDRHAPRRLRWRFELASVLLWVFVAAAVALAGTLAVSFAVR